MKRLLGVLVIAVAFAGLNVASAGATVFCVPGAAIDASCETPSSDINAALAAASSNAGHDTILLGNIDHLNSSAYAPADSSNTLTIRGIGPNAKIVKSGGGSGNVTQFSGANVTIKDLTIKGNDFSQNLMVSTVPSLIVDNVHFDAIVGSSGSGLTVNSGTSSMLNSQFTLNSSFNNCVVLSATSSVSSISNTTVNNCLVGISASGTSVTTDAVKVENSANTGVTVLNGSATLKNTLVDSALGNGAVSISMTGADLNITHSTLVGNGGSTDGVFVGSISTNATLEVADSIVSGFGDAIECNDFGSVRTFVAALDYVAHGSLHQATGSDGCTFTDTHAYTDSPGFAGIGAEPFSLASNSPLIDQIPGSLAGTDLLGNPRLSGCGRDLGAYEFVKSCPPPFVQPIIVEGTKLTNLKISPAKFKANKSAKVTYTLDFPATVDFNVTGAKKLKVKKKTERLFGKKGTNTYKLKGKWGGKKLKPGKYTLTVKPAGGSPKTIPFAIKK